MDNDKFQAWLGSLPQKKRDQFEEIQAVVDRGTREDLLNLLPCLLRQMKINKQVAEQVKDKQTITSFNTELELHEQFGIRRDVMDMPEDPVAFKKAMIEWLIKFFEEFWELESVVKAAAHHDKVETFSNPVNQ